MISFRKKIKFATATLLFLGVSFGFFAGTASADIVADIATELNIQVSSIPSEIAELPTDLTTTQTQQILSNIKDDYTVQSRITIVNSAQSALDLAQIECLKIPLIGCITDVPSSLMSTEATALVKAEGELDKANSELASALIRARNNQDPLIESYQAKNQRDNLTSETVTNITDTARRTQADFAEQGEEDIDTSTGSTISAEAINASNQKAQNASAWNTPEGDAVALQMQDECVVWSATKSTNLMPCVATVVYKLVYRPTAYALMGSGYIFDKMLMLSIDSSFVSQPFINSTWTVVRDFSNMLFIFILLYTGIMTIFGASDWKKTVLQVVFIALLINFSLFFTKVVIDAGNVLAVGVRSAIETTSVSEGLAAAFQPQQFLAAATKGVDPSGGDAIVVFLVAAVVSGFAAYVFFMAAILFSRRLIVFWFLMIVSPFAFISTALPKGNIFNKWLDILISQTFVAPVFLFFIYIIMMVISKGGGILTGFAISGGGWFESLIGPIIVALLLITALKMALSFAEDMAGSTGSAFSGLVSGAMGLATGGAASLAAGALRKGVGGYAANKLRSGTLEEGSWQHKLATGATKASFDVRNLAGEKSILGKTIGKQISKAGGAFGVDVGKAEVGGIEKAEKTRMNKILEKAKGKEVNVFEEQGVRSRSQQAHNVDENKENLDVAKKNTETAQANYNKAKESGGFKQHASLEALNKAKREEEEALKKFVDSEKTAVEDTTKAINKENTRRREEYSNKLRKKGSYTVADKIRKGVSAESDEDKFVKLAKKLAEKEAKKEESKKTGEANKPDH